MIFLPERYKHTSDGMVPDKDGGYVTFDEWEFMAKECAEFSGEVADLDELLEVLVEGLEAHDDGTYSGELRAAICNAKGTIVDPSGEAPESPDLGPLPRQPV